MDSASVYKTVNIKGNIYKRGVNYFESLISKESKIEMNLIVKNNDTIFLDLFRLPYADLKLPLLKIVLI